MGEIRNVDQLRHAIDKGKTGDKIAHPDPAAAPLGTDAEAGGVAPTAGEINLDISRLPQTPRGSASGRPKGVPIYLGLAALVFVVIIAIALFAVSS